MLDHFKEWFSRPFSQDMSATGWFAFMGLMIVISILWGYVLRTISEA